MFIDEKKNGKEKGIVDIIFEGVIIARHKYGMLKECLIPVHTSRSSKALL